MEFFSLILLVLSYLNISAALTQRRSTHFLLFLFYFLFCPKISVRLIDPASSHAGRRRRWRSRNGSIFSLRTEPFGG